MVYTDPAKQKEYNDKYHRENKDKIKEKVCLKEACEHCGRIVQHQQMQKHQMTKFCEKRRKLKNKILLEKNENANEKNA